MAIRKGSLEIVVVGGRMKRVIVSGAAGFIGSNVISALIARGVEVYALTHEAVSLPSLENRQVREIKFSLDRPNELLDRIEERDFDAFYHFAWCGSAGKARADVELQLNNALWTVECMRTAKKLGCSKFVCAGSIMEHETMAAAYTQGNRPGLGYIYGSGKVAAHIMCMSVANDIGIELVWGTITNAYGVGETSPRMLNTAIRKIIRGEPLQFTSGTQNYDFVYITDVAEAFCLIGEKGRPFCEYVIGSGEARPLKEFLMDLKETIGPDRKFDFGGVPFSGIDLELSLFDCSLLTRDTAYQAKVPFTEGICKTYEWIKEQEQYDY